MTLYDIPLFIALGFFMWLAFHFKRQLERIEEERRNDPPSSWVIRELPVGDPRRDKVADIVSRIRARQHTQRARIHDGE